jgi:hypothetical protein
LLSTGGGNHVARSNAVKCWLLPRFDEAVVGDQPNPSQIFGKTDAFLRHTVDGR